MLSWLSANLINIVLIAVLALITFLLVRGMIRNKKSGKTSCGCGCENCAMHGECHPIK